MKKMVPSVMQLASHDSNAGTNDITGLKKVMFTSFLLLLTNEFFCAITIPLAFQRYV